MKQPHRYDRMFRLLRNHYFLTALLFVVWLIFFDRNNAFVRYSYHKDLRKLEDEREYYLKEIEATRQKQHELMSNQANLEKFAREEYLMKRKNEDIFLVLRQDH